jgi:hypothetical protein
MPLPNFLIIGAAKAGTTSLYQYLKQHPQIYGCPIKGTKFFAFQEGQKVTFAGPGDQASYDRNAITDPSAYRALFDEVTHEIAIGEVSGLYLYSPVAPARIKALLPEVKLIAILRNPVDRAFSSFLHMRREGREPLTDFAAALSAEEARIKDNWEHLWHYTQVGFYYTQLKRYFDLFRHDQIAVYLYDDFKANPGAVIRDIFQFLGVDSAFTPDVSTKHNVFGKPKSNYLYQLFKKPNPVKAALKPFLPGSLRRNIKRKAIAHTMSGDRPVLAEETRRCLIQLYRDDILSLQSLIKVDLSNWLEVRRDFAHGPGTGEEYANTDFRSR